MKHNDARNPTRTSDPPEPPVDPKKVEEAPYLTDEDEALLDYIAAHIDEPSDLDDDTDEE